MRVCKKVWEMLKWMLNGMEVGSCMILFGLSIILMAVGCESQIFLLTVPFLVVLLILVCLIVYWLGRYLYDTWLVVYSKWRSLDEQV